MFDLYIQRFNEKVPLLESEMNLVRSHLTLKKLRKKQFFLQEGDVCKHIAFVEQGMLRSFTVEDDGTERIMQFAPEGWFISDLYSFLTGEPATYQIEALEDSEIAVMSKESHEILLEECPKYETFHRELITSAYIALQKRLSSIISYTLEERYEAFITQYPNIANRVPQHMIASYMGLTPETLSRVRKRIASNK